MEKFSKLKQGCPPQEWLAIHQTVGLDGKVTVQTEVLELPHGCLVRSTAVYPAALGDRLAHAMVFVPHLKLERHEDMVEFVHRA